jgi:hypothetical protein
MSKINITVKGATNKIDRYSAESNFIFQLLQTKTKTARNKAAVFT